jgi:hypothetical protein
MRAWLRIDALYLMSMAGPASNVLNDPAVLVRMDADIGQSLPQVCVSNRDVHVSRPLSLSFM